MVRRQEELVKFYESMRREPARVKTGGTQTFRGEKGDTLELPPVVLIAKGAGGRFGVAERKDLNPRQRERM